MKRNVCEIQNMHKSVQEGVMMASEVKITLSFPVGVVLCLAVRFHSSHMYPNHCCDMLQSCRSHLSQSCWPLLFGSESGLGFICDM